MICCKNWLGYDYHEAKGIAPFLTSLCAQSFFESVLRVVSYNLENFCLRPPRRLQRCQDVKLVPRFKN